MCNLTQEVGIGDEGSERLLDDMEASFTLYSWNYLTLCGKIMFLLVYY